MLSFAVGYIIGLQSFLYNEQAPQFLDFLSSFVMNRTNATTKTKISKSPNPFSVKNMAILLSIFEALILNYAAKIEAACFKSWYMFKVFSFCLIGFEHLPRFIKRPFETHSGFWW